MGRNRQARRGYLVTIATAVLAVLVVQIAVAGGGAGASPTATASVTNSQFSKLKKQVSTLQKQLKQLERDPGPQGPPGPPGEPPACEGNDATDVMVEAGAVCIDRYEVSVWSSPTGGTQYGVGSDNYPAGCADNGQGCKAGTSGEIYARSVAGVTPSSFITYFQAQQALANVGKRLPSNAEWQQAVAGTPDSASCNGGPAGLVALTGSNAACISNWGANDMIGNVREFVSDWTEETDGSCSALNSAFGGDAVCVDDQSNGDGPAAIVRGGSFSSGAGLSGAFTIEANQNPYAASATSINGFRGAR